MDELNNIIETSKVVITPELIEQVENSTNPINPVTKKFTKGINPPKRIRVIKKRAKPILNLQQKNFIEYYTNPKSETFTNAYKSALKAGFKRYYADKILSKPLNWLRELENVIGDERRLRKAEKNLEEVQDLSIKNKYGDVDTGLIMQRNKVDMFLAERLDKQKYSTRVENAVHVKIEHQLDEATRKRLDSLLS